MSIDKLKFKKLLNEYRSMEFELEYVKEVLKTAHMDFELYHRQWCADNNVDLEDLNKKNHKQVTKVMSSGETGIEIVETKQKKERHKDVFRQIAMKIHPDKIQEDDPDAWKKKNAFSKATNAIDKEEWGKLFDVVDELDIWLKDYSATLPSLEEDILRIKNEINKHKASYSWRLYTCADDEKCKEKTVRDFLKQLFNWSS